MDENTFIKCDVCQKEIPREQNSCLCSDKCRAIREAIYGLANKYFPLQRCNSSEEYRKALEFGHDLWSLIRLIYPLCENSEGEQV